MSVNKLKKEITISNITRDPYYEEDYLSKRSINANRSSYRLRWTKRLW